MGHVVLFVITPALLFLPFAAIWGADVLWQDIRDSMLWVILATFASFYLHEALHALGFMLFGRVSRESIAIKIEWKHLNFRTDCGVPMTAQSYRWSALLPAIVLGVIPAVASLVNGYGGLAMYAMFSLMGAFSDFLQVWVIRDFGNSEMVAMVIDSPYRGALNNGDNVASR